MKTPKQATKKRASSVGTIARLRARLNEAEQTLEAIRSGQVDALVVYPPEGGQKIFTLQGADHSFRRLVETMREGAATLSAQGLILYSNAHLAAMLGMPLERVIGMPLRLNVCDHSRARFDAILAEGRTRPAAGEIDLDTPNGVVPTRLSATPSDDGDGPVAICIVVTDLTEQKVNEEVVAAERLATSILEQAAEAIVVCDLDDRVIRASHAAHRLAGCNPLLRKFTEVFPLRVSVPAEGDAGSPVERALRGEILTGIETEMSTTDGATACLILAAAPLRSDHKKRLGCVIALTDVTSRKQAEQRYRFLADSMPQIVWAARPDGGVDYSNRRWHEYTGSGEHEHAWEAAVHPEDVAACVERWTKAWRSGQPFEIQVRIRRHDGSYRWHLGRALAQRTDGRIVRWFGTFTDIHDQKRAEELAEEASRLKDDFLTTVSHELRTPLTSILGWARLLRSPTLDETMRDKGLSTVERCAKAQAQLIEDLLDVSRIMSGKMRLELQPLRLCDVVTAAIDTARPAAEAKGVLLHVVLDDSSALVLGDAVRLQQIAWNLLSNAIKFTPRGGSVRVVLQRVDSAIGLEVTDDGAGMAADFLPFVFDRFRQADSSITRSKTGLGLGLSIVRHLTELHGGTVEATSDGLGKGASFRVQLPVAIGTWPLLQERRASAPDSERVTDSPMVDLTGLDVLVVDDEPDAREMLAFVLAQKGARVTTASSAQEALSKLRDEPPAVLVSDIGMPVEDGLSLIRKVRELSVESGGRVPAIALTAYTRAEDRTRALRAGFQTHLGKPVEPAELALVVARLAGRYQPAQ